VTPEGVLAVIRGSGLMFSVQESDEVESHSASSLARRIAVEDAPAGKPPMEAGAFIDRYCTRSSTHGTPYRVKTGDGDRPLAGWLRERLKLPPAE